MSDYVKSQELLNLAQANRATHVTLNCSEGVQRASLHDAIEGWRVLLPGEPYDVLGLHWEPQTLFFEGTQPEPAVHTNLEQLYRAWIEAKEGDSNDAEISTSDEFIEALLGFARISYEETAEERECARCGDEVTYLNSEGECDSCTLADRCFECDENIDEEDGRDRFKGMCTSCVHNAERSGA